MRRQFHTLDVFTETPFAGNPLAVVRDCAGLDGARMQAIAREFNLSETVFLLPPRDPVNTARARIFTPMRELPFAGHPTIGAAVLIGELDGREFLGKQDLSLVIEEEAGAVRCDVWRSRGRATRARFDLPHLPRREGGTAAAADIARALSLDEADIGFDDHVPCLYSAGVGFTFVPLRSTDAVARAWPDMAWWNAAIGPAEHPAAFVYCRETQHEAHHVHARMFAPSLGIAEDPATGGAAAAFAGVCMDFEHPEDGQHTIVIEQGYEMGRPSLINLGLDVAGGRLVSASIGGAAIVVSQGTIDA